jgi:hypothetical protein
VAAPSLILQAKGGGVCGGPKAIRRLVEPGLKVKK